MHCLERNLQMNKDEQFMMRAIELARWGEGLTRPNPPVGAVLAFGWLDGPVFEAYAGVRGFWVGLLAGLGCAALILVTRFHWLSSRDQHILAYASR